MIFEWKISIGTVIQIAVFVAGIIGLYYKIDARVAALEIKLQPILRWWYREAVPRFQHQQPKPGEGD